MRTSHSPAIAWLAYMLGIVVLLCVARPVSAQYQLPDEAAEARDVAEQGESSLSTTPRDPRDDVLNQALTLRTNNVLAGYLVGASTWWMVAAMDRQGPEDEAGLELDLATLGLALATAYGVYSAGRTGRVLHRNGIPVERTRLLSWLLWGGGATLFYVSAALQSWTGMVGGTAVLTTAATLLPALQTALHSQALHHVRTGDRQVDTARLLFSQTLLLGYLAYFVSHWNVASRATDLAVAGGVSALMVGMPIYEASVLRRTGRHVRTTWAALSLVSLVGSLGRAGRDVTDGDYWTTDASRASWALAGASVVFAGAQTYANRTVIDRELVETDPARWSLRPVVLQDGLGVALGGRF